MFITGSDKDKVIDYNTLKLGSIKTDTPVRRIYLRALLDSIDASHLINNEKVVRRFKGIVNQFTNTISIGDVEPTSIEVFEALGYNFGSYLEFQGNSNNQFRNKEIIDLFRDGLLLPKSMFKYNIANAYNVSDTVISTEISKPYSLVTKPDRVHVKIREIITGFPNKGFDPSNIEVFSYSRPITETINIFTNENSHKINNGIPVVKLKNPAGMYYVNVNNDTYELDLSTGFIFSSSELVYLIKDNPANLPAEDRANRDVIPHEMKVKITDEIGRTVAAFTTTERYISLLDIFEFELPEITGKTFSKTYPLTPLLEDEFSLHYGAYVFPSPFSGAIKQSRVVREELDFEISKDIDEDNFLVLDKAKQIKTTYPLSDFNFKKVVKLDHTSILNDSILIDPRGASVNAFIKEVPYQDGESEFRISKRNSQINNRNLNRIQLDDFFVEDGEILFEEDTSRFQYRVYSKEELIEEGDWMIVKEGNNFFIDLPEGVRTSSVFDTEILYNIEETKKSSSGLYSVDYKKGIIYTVAPVDSRIKVSYIYTYVFAKYEALNKLRSENYSIQGNLVSINSNSTDGKNIVILARNNQSIDSLKYKTSPIVSNVKINTITKEDFL